jgi:hypothetical protein
MNLNTERSGIWKALKSAGWQPDEGRTFVSYSRDELVSTLQAFQESTGQVIDVIVPDDEPAPAPPQEAVEAPQLDAEAAAFFGLQQEAPAAPEPAPVQQTGVLRSNVADPSTLPGQQTLSDELVPIRVDDQGRTWYQEEVKKPAYPKPRGRRILRYLDKGVKTETVIAGEYVESFEVAGDGPGRPAEIKITLPSYQVGIYGDPRFPFKIHTYNGSEGFNLEDVETFYGGPEMVPDGVKRIYIENDLCYDIRSVIKAVQEEHRINQLTGRV